MLGVGLNTFILDSFTFTAQVLESNHITVSDRELDRLDKMSDAEGLVNRSTS